MNRPIINQPSRSIHSINHEYFDRFMHSVFIPLNPQEEELFLKAVIMEEKDKQRVLSYEELVRIASKIS